MMQTRRRRRNKYGPGPPQRGLRLLRRSATDATRAAFVQDAGDAGRVMRAVHSVAREHEAYRTHGVRYLVSKLKYM